MPPEHVGPMRRAYSPRMFVQSKGRFRERKKLTLVKAQAYWKATKSKKSQMLDDFCQGAGYCRRYASRVLHLAGQRYLLGDCILSWLILRSISTDTVHPGM